MDILPPDSFGSAATSHKGRARPDEVAHRWATLHEAAAIVAALAGVSDGADHADLTTFPAALRQSSGWRRTTAEQGIEDISLILQSGIAALLSARDKGATSAAPARALWEEFLAARAALVALVPEDLLNRRRLG